MENFTKAISEYNQNSPANFNDYVSYFEDLNLKTKIFCVYSIY